MIVPKYGPRSVPRGGRTLKPTTPRQTKVRLRRRAR